MSVKDTHQVWKTLQTLAYPLALKQRFAFVWKGQVGGHLVVSDGTAGPGVHGASMMTGRVDAWDVTMCVRF